jgi:outer membrane protein TolC
MNAQRPRSRRAGRSDPFARSRAAAFSTSCPRSFRIAWLTVVLLAVIASAKVVRATSLSYVDARNVLHSVSDLHKSAEAGVGVHVYQARAAESLGLPEVSVQATQIYGQKTGSLSTPLGTLGVDLNFNGPRSSVDSTWAIYTGGRITATQRSLAAGVDQARAELASSDEHLDLELTQVYFGQELAANIERTRLALLQAADRHLERARRFEQRGVYPMIERLNAQVSRDEAERELVRAKRDREIAQARLQRLLHRDTPVDVSTPLFVISSALKPLSDWLDTAERQNPILSAFDAKREQARQSIVIADSRWKPEVFAFASYAMIRHYQTLIEPNWIAGIGIKFTLFSREDRASGVSAAREGLRQVESLEAETRNQIDSAVETAYRKVEQAREQFNLLDSTLNLARENLRLRERGFEEGQATSLDVNDARNALARAETARSTAAYEFVVALAALLEASGQAHSLPEFVDKADIQLRS